MVSKECNPNPPSRPRLAKRVRMQTDPVTHGPVLLTQETVIVLNRTGHEVLRRCDGSRTVSQITLELCSLYPAAGTSLAEDVSCYLQRLTQKGWVEWI
jgi:pyrroloquinoline quinone biosynthesis protein D